MELEEAGEEQYDFEEIASSKFSYTAEQSTSRPGLFTNFDNRDLTLLRTVIHNSGLLSNQRNAQHRRLVAPDANLSENNVSSKKEPSAISSQNRISRYARSNEEQDDDDLEVEPFDDEHWVRDEQLDLAEEELVYLRKERRLSLLDNLTQLPDIEEISSSLSEETVTPTEQRTVDYNLVGKFVDPLTGLETEPSQQTDDLEYDFVDMEEFGEYDIETDNVFVDVTEDSELLELEDWDVNMEQFEEAKLAQREDAIIDFEPDKQITTTTDIKFEQALLEDTQPHNEIIVSAFVDELIQFVVESAQYKDPKEVLRKSIDKRKLMEEINEKLRVLEVEQSLRLYLNRKIVDYHKRKRLFRAIIDDSPENIEYFMAKYQDQLQRCDEIMGKEEELQTATKLMTEKLNAILVEKELRLQEKVLEFEELVRQALLPKQDAMEAIDLAKKKEKYQDFIRNINVLLAKFTTSRKEISKYRLALIKKQHLFAELQEDLRRVEDLGNGLLLPQFENLQNEVKQLSKKTEERNTELAKARIHRQLDVHISTHMKERTLMLRDTIAVQKLSYRALLQERDATRHRLYKKKMTRAQIRKETREYDFQGGLLSKPALMLDYDNTLVEVKRKEEIVRGLRSQYKKISEKIAQYEHLLDSGFQNKLL